MLPRFLVKNEEVSVFYLKQIKHFKNVFNISLMKLELYHNFEIYSRKKAFKEKQKLNWLRQRRCGGDFRFHNSFPFPA